MFWYNHELSRTFEDLARRAQIAGESVFRTRAYEKAAVTIRLLSEDITAMDREAIAALPGVGAATAEKIDQWLRTGIIDELETYRAQIPDGVVILTNIPGLGVKTAARLHRELGIDSLQTLADAITDGRIASLPRMGKKSVDKLADGLRAYLALRANGFPTFDGLTLEAHIHQVVHALDPDAQVTTVGDWRRGKLYFKVLEFTVASDVIPTLIKGIVLDRACADLLTAEDDFLLFKSPAGIPVAITLTTPARYGIDVLTTTGPDAHVSTVMDRLSDPNAPYPTEAAVYEAAGLQPVKPTLRERSDILDLAAEGTIPDVVTVADLVGDLHGHSTWSGDGLNSLIEMATRAKDNGLEYWAATDHAEDLAINGLSPEQVLARRKELAGIGDSLGITILDGSELNIGMSGEVDYNPEILAAFDWTVASVHNNLEADPGIQTDRILTAITNPFVNCIGHLRGRKVGQRPGFEVELAAILEACRETGTALEINAHPVRLDIDAPIIEAAIKARVTLTISCDAHDLASLGYARFGVWQAQRALALPAHILNCQPIEAVRAFVNAKRR
ncbi:helix-hairpin-helix domain-containing protein [Stomatohabitans albus]|uniref:helix-hairpin-helix domain-containing protein n=1 Tax=Stomatohabitans albus TaxID=3110766 RepID=UPI00300D1485